jgi:hypothetical protein
MRSRLLCLAVIILCILPVSVSTEVLQTPKGAKVEALYALSVAYVLVQLTVTNHNQDSVALPFCGGSDLCDFYVQLEQSEDGKTSHWKRAVPHWGADVTFDRVAEVKPGESLQATFRFNPLDWKFEDGRTVRYPGRVRIAVWVWPKREWIGHTSVAIELFSNDFEIPPPPPVWKRGKTSSH